MTNCEIIKLREMKENLSTGKHWVLKLSGYSSDVTSHLEKKSGRDLDRLQMRATVLPLFKAWTIFLTDNLEVSPLSTRSR